MKIFQKIMNRNPFLSVYKRAELWRDDLSYVGNEVQIFHKVSFGSEPYLISLGDKTKITYGCTFITHDGGIYVLRNLYPDMEKASIYGRITVGNNCFIGNNAIILPGVSIGNNCIIAAGAVVSKSIPDNSVAAGVPCKVICSTEEYYQKNKNFALNTIGLGETEKRKMIFEATSEGRKLLILK